MTTTTGADNHNASDSYHTTKTKDDGGEMHMTNGMSMTTTWDSGAFITDQCISITVIYLSSIAFQQALA